MIFIGTETRGSRVLGFVHRPNFFSKIHAVSQVISVSIFRWKTLRFWAPYVLLLSCRNDCNKTLLLFLLFLVAALPSYFILFSLQHLRFSQQAEDSSLLVCDAVSLWRVLFDVSKYHSAFTFTVKHSRKNKEYLFLDC